MQIEIKGICRTVTRVIEKNSNGNVNRFQSMIVTVPGYVDGFGEKKGKDEDWEIQLINNAIDKHLLHTLNLQGKKLIVKAYLNSRTYKSDGEEKFMLQLNLASFEVYKPA